MAFSKTASSDSDSDQKSDLFPHPITFTKRLCSPSQFNGSGNAQLGLQGKLGIKKKEEKTFQKPAVKLGLLFPSDSDFLEGAPSPFFLNYGGPRNLEKNKKKRTRRKKNQNQNQNQKRKHKGLRKDRLMSFLKTGGPPLKKKSKSNCYDFRIALQNRLISTEYSLETFHRSNQDTCLLHNPAVFEGDWVQSGDLLADCAASAGGELSIGKNILVAYMPWEGYNFEDAILISERLVFEDVYSSIHIERYDIEIRETEYGMETITRHIPELNTEELDHLDSNGVAKLGSWVEEGDVLVGRITPINIKALSTFKHLLYTILEAKPESVRDSSLRAPKGMKGKIINVQRFSSGSLDAPLTLKTSSSKTEVSNRNPQTLKRAFNSGINLKALLQEKEQRTQSNSVTPELAHITKLEEVPINIVYVYLAEKRQIQVGDKMAGRHGNKGIVSQILPRQDMPFLANGTPIDMVLNPLGVPSRMNVGQIYECLLGLAAKYLGEHYKIFPFDEKYGPEASRSFVYSKLYEARKKTGSEWLFNPNCPGKTRLFDGRTGDPFDQSVTVGYAYMLKLVHLVDDKIHMRSTGPYSLVTQQPLRGRSKQGGQRLGEMEVWALEGYGAAFTLLEMLTLKSDDMTGRMTLWSNLIYNKDISIGTPESFKVLVCELQALCLDIGIFRANSEGKLAEIESLKELP